jgi:hypothetical protein
MHTRKFKTVPMFFFLLAQVYLVRVFLFPDSNVSVFMFQARWWKARKLFRRKPVQAITAATVHLSRPQLRWQWQLQQLPDKVSASYSFNLQISPHMLFLGCGQWSCDCSIRSLWQLRHKITEQKYIEDAILV